MVSVKAGNHHGKHGSVYIGNHGGNNGKCLMVTMVSVYTGNHSKCYTGNHGKCLHW